MNEPVAIVKKITIGGIDNFPIEQFVRLKEGTLLYTHPVKELTDEEIANTWDDVRKDATLKSSMKDIQDFARAILRKAQK